MPSVGFEPTVPAGEWPQTYALDRAATGTGNLSEWREFPSKPCLAVEKKLDIARVSMLLKSHASLTCFRACFLPGRAKDLSAP